MLSYLCGFECGLRPNELSLDILRQFFDILVAFFAPWACIFNNNINIWHKLVRISWADTAVHFLKSDLSFGSKKILFMTACWSFCERAIKTVMPHVPFAYITYEFDGFYTHAAAYRSVESQRCGLATSFCVILKVKTDSNTPPNCV